MFWFILFIVIIGIVIFVKTGNRSLKQITLTYQYLVMVMLACDDKDDFRKLLWRMFAYDTNNTPIDEFNSKWEAICEAAKVPAIKKDYGGVMGVSNEVVEMIADNIYDNALNKRYVSHIKSQFPSSMSFEQLKEKGI